MEQTAPASLYSLSHLEGLRDEVVREIEKLNKFKNVKKSIYWESDAVLKSLISIAHYVFDSLQEEDSSKFIIEKAHSLQSQAMQEQNKISQPQEDGNTHLISSKLEEIKSMLSTFQQQLPQIPEKHSSYNLGNIDSSISQEIGQELMQCMKHLESNIKLCINNQSSIPLVRSEFLNGSDVDQNANQIQSVQVLERFDLRLDQALEQLRKTVEIIPKIEQIHRFVQQQSLIEEQKTNSLIDKLQSSSLDFGEVVEQEVSHSIDGSYSFTLFIQENEYIFASGKPYTLHVLNSKDLSLVKTLSIERKYIKAGISLKDKFFLGCSDYLIYAYDIKTFTKLKMIQIKEGINKLVEFEPEVMICCQNYGHVQLINTTDYQIIAEIQLKLKGDISDIAILTDKQVLALATSNGLRFVEIVKYFSQTFALKECKDVFLDGKFTQSVVEYKPNVLVTAVYDESLIYVIDRTQNCPIIVIQNPSVSKKPISLTQMQLLGMDQPVLIMGDDKGLSLLDVRHKAAYMIYKGDLKRGNAHNVLMYAPYQSKIQVQFTPISHVEQLIFLDWNGSNTLVNKIVFKRDFVSAIQKLMA